MCTIFGIKCIVGVQWSIITIWANIKLESSEKSKKKKENKELLYWLSTKYIAFRSRTVSDS